MLVVDRHSEVELLSVYHPVTIRGLLRHRPLRRRAIPHVCTSCNRALVNIDIRGLHYEVINSVFCRKGRTQEVCTCTYVPRPAGGRR